jgi:KaiC/GvpD/RAD55 family RecA-like ATPase
MFVEFTESEIESFYRVRVPGLKKVGREWRGPCPVHSGKDANFGVDPSTGQWFCFSRCGRGGGLIDLEMELRRLEFVPAKLEVFRIVGRPEPDFQELAFEATYDYTDANGKLLYQVVRKPGKVFMQRRWLDGRWSWALGDTPRVPFHLPEVLACQTVIGITEGEKDALNLTRAGWVATCNSGGGCNFRPELVPHFAGKHVAIFPDNDDKGRQHADLVARLLSPVAASLKIVVIPDLPEKGDVSDFLARGGTGLDLRRMYREAPDWTPDLKPETPVIHENDRYLRTFADELRAAGGFEGFWKSLDVEGLPTPFPALTRKLGGMRKGEVYILAARTGQGKTSLVLQFADAALASRTGVLLFSMEMGHRDAFQRLAAQRARVDLAQFRYLRRTGLDSPLLWEMTTALREATETYAQSPLYVSTKSAVTPEFLHAESMRVRERSEVGLVVVDHMQLMGGDPRARSEYEKFTAISRITKRIAVELEVPLILVSQVNRSNAERKGNELEMTDLRSSGALEEDAAVVMLLYYDNADWKEAGRDPTGERMKRGPIDSWLKLAKNRYGCSGTYEKLVHMKSITRFDVSSERRQAVAAHA